MSGHKGRDIERETPPDTPLSDAAAAAYLAGILPELVKVADRGGLDLVAYLLEMARIEVTDNAMGRGGRKPG